MSFTEFHKSIPWSSASLGVPWSWSMEVAWNSMNSSLSFCQWNFKSTLGNFFHRKHYSTSNSKTTWSGIGILDSMDLVAFLSFYTDTSLVRMIMGHRNGNRLWQWLRRTRGGEVAGCEGSTVRRPETISDRWLGDRCLCIAG